MEYVSNILDLTITGLPIEAQKAWIPHNFSQEEVSERVKKWEEIETKLFGWNVRENEYEVSGSFEVLIKLFEKQPKIFSWKWVGIPIPESFTLKVINLFFSSKV